MFCCRGSKCLGDGEDKHVISGRKIENQKLVLKQNGTTVTEADGKLNPIMFNSVPSKMLNSVPRKTLNSVPSKTLNSVPSKTLNSVPSKMLNSVPSNMLTSVPSKMVNSVPSKMVNSVPSKMANSVPRKMANNEPSNIGNSVPSKMVNSVPSKMVNSVPNKMVNSVPNKMVNSVPSNMLNSVPSITRTVLRPDAKHVTNVQKDVYVKLQNVLKSQEISSRSHGSYRVILFNKSNTVAIPNPAHQRPAVSYNTVAIPNPAHQRPTVSYTNPFLVQDHTPNPATQPVKDSVRLSTEVNISDEDNRKRTPYPMTTKNDGGNTVSDDSALVIFDKADVESLTDEQKQVLEQLDASLNGYEEIDDEIPTIIADVLPFGVTGSANEVNVGENFSPAESSSEDEPSSATSSLSNHSMNSRTGIINKKCQRLNMKKNRNTVSFQLPFDHVDKPYSPMQTASKNQNKITIVTTLNPEPQRSPPQPQESTLHVTGNDVSIWHSNNGVYVENKHQRRLSTGPFKGSFKSLFYTKYSNSDLKSYDDHTGYLTPKIMEKVASFENINDVQKSNRKPVLRSNTYRTTEALKSLTATHSFC